MSKNLPLFNLSFGLFRVGVTTNTIIYKLAGMMSLKQYFQNLKKCHLQFCLKDRKGLVKRNVDNRHFGLKRVQQNHRQQFSEKIIAPCSLRYIPHSVFTKTTGHAVLAMAQLTSNCPCSSTVLERGQSWHLWNTCRRVALLSCLYDLSCMLAVVCFLRVWCLVS